LEKEISELTAEAQNAESANKKLFSCAFCASVVNKEAQKSRQSEISPEKNHSFFNDISVSSIKKGYPMKSENTDKGIPRFRKFN